MERAVPTVEEIFFAALELESSQARASFLDRHCHDPTLRRRVEELLSVDAQGAEFLEAPAPMATMTGGPEPSPAVDVSGKSIGPYKLLEPIGEGGMGTVYMAEQFEPVRREVALKVIRPGMDSKQVIARFEAERQALAMMDHPNIARVFDGGMTPSGRPYFVMELVRGVPITEYCDHERLLIPERLELFVLVCRAVQHAHQKGIIHRDLKPSNILVTVIDGAAVPKVIDFGVAKATGQSLTEKTLITGFHQFVGTPLYMSPEQADLSGDDVDTRSDVYSLGVLLYELLTGTTPFDSEMLRRAAFDEVRRIIREEEPPTPSTRLKELGTPPSTSSPDRPIDSRKLIPAVRGELDWIAMKALEKDRARRYQTANDLAADVLRHLADQPIEACPPSHLYRVRKFVRRNRSRLAATGLIGLLGLGLSVAIGRQAVQRAEAAGAVARALDAADLAIAQRKWPDALAAVNQAEARIDQGGGDRARSRTTRLKQDLAMVSRLDEIRQQMSAVKDDHFDIGLADRLYGEAFRDYGIDADALGPEAVAGAMPAGPVREELIAALDDWMRIRRGMSGRDDADWQRLLAAARAADPDPWRNRVREAWVKRDGKALGELAASAPFDRLHPCDVLLLEASLDNDRAVALLREAQRRRPGDFWLNHALGMRLHDTRPSRFDEAIGYLRTASALRPESPGAILNVGHVLQLAERTEEAIAAFEQAIRLKPDYAMAYSNLGAALLDAERLDEAIGACREAIRLDPNSAEARGNFGRALLRTGELGAAIVALREALRLDPDSHQATTDLVEACLGKIAAGLQVIRRSVDEHLVRLSSPRPFLHTLLDTRSPPMLQRCLVLNLLASGLLAATAHAQTGPGTIYYKYGSGTPNIAYRVDGDGRDNAQIGPFLTYPVRSTALDNYPGGRQFLSQTGPLGPLPGISGSYGDITLCSELDATPTTVTNFRGPQWIDQNGIRARLSNDGQDSFLSFVAYDTRTGLWIYYRYNGPVSDIFQPGFVPFVSDDPRLDTVMSMPPDSRSRGFWDWDPTGTMLTFSDRDANGKTLIYVHDTTTSSSNLVNNPYASGIDLPTPWCSPTEFRLFGPATHTNGTKGLVSLYPSTGQWRWVIKEGGSGSKKISAFSATATSPDGTALAFGMLRVVNKKTVPSLVRISVNGGSYTPLVNFPASTENTINPGGLGWKW